MAVTLSTARTRLRFRLGETSPGTWTNAELNDVLNVACQQVVTDSVTQGGQALLVEQKEFRSEPGTYLYVMPTELNEVLAVLYRVGNQLQVVPQAMQTELFLEGFDDTVSVSIPFSWQYYPSVRYLVTQGIATQRSTTSLIDDDRTGSLNYAFDSGTLSVDAAGGVLGADDLVVNVTDGSQGNIAAVTDAREIQLDTQTEESGLSGGLRNIFQHGDKYKIYQREADLRCIWLTPPQSNAESEQVLEVTTGTTAGTVNVGNVGANRKLAAQTFLLEDDEELRAVWVSYDSSTGDPKGNLVVKIEQTTASVPNGNLLDIRGRGTFPIASLSAGWNRIPLVAPFRIAPAVTYGITFEISPQSDYYSGSASNDNYIKLDTYTAAYTDGAAYTKTAGGAWSAASTDILFKLDATNAKPSLVVSYSKYPATLSADTDLVELPPYAHEAMYLYAEYWAYLKKASRRGNDASAVAFAMYERAIEKIKTLLMNQSSSGYSAVRDVWSPYGRIGLETVRTADPRRFQLPLSYSS